MLASGRMKPMFSVIIPTYDRLPFLKRTLESVWQQTFTEYEIIVVDDGSTDGTDEYLETIGDRAQIIRGKNRGPGSARNAAIENACGEYVAFLDSDDLWFPWTLETYRLAIEQNESPSFLVGHRLPFSEEGVIAGVDASPPSLNYTHDYLCAAKDWFWTGASALVAKTQALRACGGFTEENANGEDGDLCLKLGAQKGFVQVLAPYTVAYREHDANIAHDIRKLIAGSWMQINNERAGIYPGGAARRRERWHVLSRQLRPVTLQGLRSGHLRESWSLYTSTFRWHVSLRRWKYLFGFPLLALRSMAGRPGDS
jgi:glycosyltransferase involved in cell wall biosynthesis